MILIIDHDREILTTIETYLQREGYATGTATAGSEALAVAVRTPDLVIVAARMPVMDGFELLQEYTRRFSHRLTPFIMLAAEDDHEAVVRGLDLGADDIVTKPLRLDILRAKVRGVITRKTRYTSPTFYGDLSRISCLKLLEFCARRALTGEVIISSASRHARLQIRGGAVVPPETPDPTEFLAGLYDLAEGTFVIHTQPLEFKEIEEAAMPLALPAPDHERPAGRLTAIRFGTRIFQVQTELTALPRDRIITIVNLGGRIILKRESLPREAALRAEIEKLIETQHRAVEEEIRERMNPDVIKEVKSREYLTDRFNQLFDEGCERFREKDYQTALRKWAEAALFNRDDPALQLNLQIVRKKLGMPPAKSR